MDTATKVRTGGSFFTETSAWEVFDAIIDKCEAFRMYREVEGEFVHPRPMTHEKPSDTEKVRIDRLLVPQSKAIASGWIGGAFGVEGKRSDMKLGPLVTQAIDYSRCVFKLELEKGKLLALVMLKWIFIYPVGFYSGELVSLMANHRIGTCDQWAGDGLLFACAATNGIKIYPDGRIEAKDLPMGNKRGSR